MLCKKCGEEKDQELFKKNKLCKSGYEHTCKACTQLRQKAWEHSNPTRHKENQLRWREENPEQYKAAKDAWYQQNKHLVFERSKAYAKEHSEWKRNLTAKRRAQKLRAIPPWADLPAIAKVYKQAKEQGMVVDHIVPLQGKYVSGLHVVENLQLLTASENSKKSNTYIVE